MTKPFKITNKFGTFHYKSQTHTLYHREDGPAIEFANGEKRWYLNGNLHREDGPAKIFTNNNKEWWLNGKECSEKEHEVLTKRKNLINFL